MKKYILLSLFIFVGNILADEYTNELTGKFTASKWSKETNGLIARLCSNKKNIQLGAESPTFLLEIKNVSKKKIFINDTISSHMLLIIKPQKIEYTNYDMEWIFDEDRRKIPLKPNEAFRAVCKLPMKLVPESGKYQFSIKITRGIYPPGLNSIPMRGKDWWTGILTPPTLEIEYK